MWPELPATLVRALARQAEFALPGGALGSRKQVGRQHPAFAAQWLRTSAVMEHAWMQRMAIINARRCDSVVGGADCPEEKRIGQSEPLILPCR